MSLNHRQIEFIEPLGNKSWRVRFNGWYRNDRQPHVELRAHENDLGTPYDTMIPGTIYNLINFRKTKHAMMWDVEGLVLKDKKLAHFTVSHTNAFKAKAQQLRRSYRRWQRPLSDW